TASSSSERKTASAAAARPGGGFHPFMGRPEASHTASPPPSIPAATSPPGLVASAVTGRSNSAKDCGGSPHFRRTSSERPEEKSSLPSAEAESASGESTFIPRASSRRSFGPSAPSSVIDGGERLFSQSRTAQPLPQ